MKKWGGIYLSFGLGILAAAGLAYWYWVETYGEPPEDQ